MIAICKSNIFLAYGIVIGICCGFVIRNYRALEIVKKCSFKPDMMNRNPFEIIDLKPNETIENSQTNFIFVGVMTAKNFLEGRANAVYHTWGKEVPGKIAFFSSEKSYSEILPVVALKGVDDRYPPQKKSFMMLHYMYEHFIDKFEWFMRTDDDVYISTWKLERFLRSIDSSKPQFIGQAGKGNTEEFGLLSLEYDENFCMGGPGVILSRETLRRVAPHIPTCLKNLYSTHEDVEIGRCVQKYAGIPCTWNYEMQSILHHNSSGKFAFTGNLKSKEIHNAITLHPVKRAPLMYRLHSYMQGLRIQDMRQEALSLHRDIAKMEIAMSLKPNENVLTSGVSIFPFGAESEHYLGDHDILGVTPALNKCTPEVMSDIQYWNFIGRSMYSAEQANPKKKIESAFKEGLDDVVTEVMDSINNFSRQRGRVIEFRELLYGYSRVNVMYGHDLILDLLLIYKKYRGKKMTVPVRRHLYIQRAFTDLVVREIQGDAESEKGRTKENDLLSLSSKVKDLWNTGLGRISIIGGATETKKRDNLKNDKIVFVMAIAGRFTTFQRFLRNYEETCLRTSNANAELLTVFFDEPSELQPFLIELSKVKANFPTAVLNHISLSGNFSRGKALDYAARSSYINDNDIILFIDVDMTFQTETLDRVRMNTMLHRQVYFPIVFSQYDPNRMQHLNAIGNHNSNDVLGYESGFFRQFGFGICAIYKSDILNPAINGFNTDITGWGLEDVKLLERIIKLNQNQPSQLLNTAEGNDEPSIALNYESVKPKMLSVFRSPDDTLIHVFHPINCDRNLEESQYQMCQGTKANTLGSYKLIESVLLSNRTLMEYLFVNRLNGEQ
ncbi:hypothetical protein HA402_005083 [Bradysia odoriphaga]|nr:hypothetical protein HA402_005083 [Bradysia odoriphaga]